MHTHVHIHRHTHTHSLTSLCLPGSTVPPDLSGRLWVSHPGKHSCSHLPALTHAVKPQFCPGTPASLYSTPHLRNHHLTKSWSWNLRSDSSSRPQNYRHPPVITARSPAPQQSPASLQTYPCLHLSPRSLLTGLSAPTLAAHSPSLYSSQNDLPENVRQNHVFPLTKPF